MATFIGLDDIRKGFFGRTEITKPRHSDDSHDENGNQNAVPIHGNLESAANGPAEAVNYPDHGVQGIKLIGHFAELVANQCAGEADRSNVDPKLDNEGNHIA